MTDELDQQVRLALRRQKRTRKVPIAVIVFAIIASASAYLWVNYGDLVRSTRFGTPTATAPGAASGDATVSRADFDAFERQTADLLRSASENLEAQKADLKKLSDQVAALVAKVDALQSGPATPPAPTPVRNSIAAQPIVPPPAAIPQRRKPPAPKPAGSISVGGAPLPAPSPDR